MDKLGDAKGTIARNDALITIDDGFLIRLVEMTGKFTANVKGVIDVTSFTGFNGVRVSPFGNYVVITESSGAAQGFYLYDSTGNFIEIIPGTDGGSQGRTQHSDWGIDADGNEAFIVMEALTPFYYVPATGAFVWLELDLASSDTRFGNGFLTGQCWDRPGFAYISSSEGDPDNSIVGVKLKQTTQTRTLNIPNGIGSQTGFVAERYIEVIANFTSGTGEITCSLDGQQIVADSNAGTNTEAPYLIAGAGFAAANWE